MGPFQDWYSGQMENSYSSNRSLGRLYDLVTYDCGGLYFWIEISFFALHSQITEATYVSIMMYVIAECGEIVFPSTFIEEKSGSYHFV